MGADHEAIDPDRAEFREILERVREQVERLEQYEPDEKDEPKSSDWLLVHPVICIMLGFFLLSFGMAGCSIEKYYRMQAEALEQQHGR